MTLAEIRLKGDHLAGLPQLNERRHKVTVNSATLKDPSHTRRSVLRLQARALGRPVSGRRG